jgi:hypothetical protein
VEFNTRTQIEEDIMAQIKKIQELSEFYKFLEKREFAFMKQNLGNYIIFAPSNEALKNLKDLGIEITTDVMQELLLYHTVEGSKKDVMANGEKMYIEDLEEITTRSFAIVNNFFVGSDCSVTGGEKPWYVQKKLIVNKDDDEVLHGHEKMIYILRHAVMLPPSLMKRRCDLILYNNKWCSEIRLGSTTGKKQCIAKTTDKKPCKNYPCGESPLCYTHTTKFKHFTNNLKHLFTTR